MVVLQVWLKIKGGREGENEDHNVRLRSRDSQVRREEKAHGTLTSCIVNKHLAF